MNYYLQNYNYIIYFYITIIFYVLNTKGFLFFVKLDIINAEQINETFNLT